ncbi:hypothetical protein [Priestia taiwanensis]|uniref:Uncharacterized protein n=1 Tax=Priestia taiwanensis TaxID=1347902 RepID=A0A917AME1_9BACI|nr:hypothetical protein [Priestia taiwanensis]MBM7361966.1 divalent metal cation (Fe/Co/Zn/Cd) transporter [Priestia taiwanensis]GGE58389.1 hypothetical protein GCM10007140_05930 [Priestia taiwanensis]
MDKKQTFFDIIEKFHKDVHAVKEELKQVIDDECETYGDVEKYLRKKEKEARFDRNDLAVLVIEELRNEARCLMELEPVKKVGGTMNEFLMTLPESTKEIIEKEIEKVKGIEKLHGINPESYLGKEILWQSKKLIDISHTIGEIKIAINRLIK